MDELRPGHHDLIRRREFLGGLGALAACGRAQPSVPELFSEPRPLGTAFQRGMNFAHLHRDGFGYGSDRARRQAERLFGLGVRQVALNPFGYMRSSSSPEVHWGGDSTLTDANLIQQIGQLQALGMEVMLKPHIWAWSYLTGSGNMDIRFDAEGWKRWFASYTAFAVHYAQLAEQTGCACLCIGLEFTGASKANPGAWAGVAAECRKIYGGKLGYAANWYEEFEVFADWDAFDWMGVNAYFPLAGSSVEELAASWKPHLDRIEAVAKGRPVLFPEAGYRAVDDATTTPWNADGAPDEGLQARAYEALFRACTERPWFRGVYWWKWFTDLPGEGDSFVPADRPAERVMAAWYGA